jgi:hypothetical protein
MHLANELKHCRKGNGNQHKEWPIIHIKYLKATVYITSALMLGLRVLVRKKIKFIISVLLSYLIIKLMAQNIPKKY